VSAAPTPFPLSDDEWKRLNDITRLPEDARQELENILRHGKLMAEIESTAPPAHTTRKRLELTRRRAEALRVDLQDIRDCEYEALVALSYSYCDWLLVPPAPPQRPLLLDKTIADLTSLVDWLKRAREKVPNERTGNRTQAAHYMTREINALLVRHKTGLRLRPGEKKSNPARELLAACFELLKIDITPETAIRRLASKYRKVPL
jgi:hypothetical protein